jgi:hypothetical protein
MYENMILKIVAHDQIQFWNMFYTVFIFNLNYLPIFISEEISYKILDY